MTVKTASEAMAELAVPRPSDAALLSTHEAACVSIFLGPHQGGSGTRPSRIRLRAILAEVSRFLDSHGLLRVDREDLLLPLLDLCEGPEMAAGHAEGLAIFRSPDSLYRFKVPAVAESWSVGRWFQVRTLLECLRENREYFLLTLTRKQARLLRCGGDSVRETPMPTGVTANFEDFLGFDEADKTLMSHSPGGHGVGGMRSVQFGTGTTRERQIRRFHDFCKGIDRGLRPMLHGENLPLILAGTESEVAAYLGAAEYANIVKRAVFTSPDDGVTDNELWKRSRVEMDPWCSEETERAIEQFKALSDAEKALSETLAIIGAAHRGRVAHLFVTEGAREEGELPMSVGPASLSGDLTLPTEDLINAAVVKTLNHSGKVHIVPADRAPAGTTLAATLRY